MRAGSQRLYREVKSFMSLPRLVHFFGPDGAGKSTQVNILIAFLIKRGFKVRKYWVRSPHTLAFVLWVLFVKIGFYRVVEKHAAKLPAVDRNRILRGFWSMVELIGVLPIILLVYLSMLRGYRLVAERYVLDTITTIAYFINDIRFLKSPISKLLLRFIPSNTAFIFLDSDYETIYQRRAPSSATGKSVRNGRKTYDSHSKSSVEPRFFIEFQRTAYKVLAKSLDALVIDTSKLSVEKTSSLILQYLGLN